jgi:hypothetical protein
MGTQTREAALLEWHSINEEPSSSDGRGGCVTRSGANNIEKLVHCTVTSTSQAEKGISKEWRKG